MFFLSRNISPQDKLQAVGEYLTGNGIQESIAKKYNVDHKALSAWLNKYRVKDIYFTELKSLQGLKIIYKVKIIIE